MTCRATNPMAGRCQLDDDHDAAQHFAGKKLSVNGQSWLTYFAWFDPEEVL